MCGETVRLLNVFRVNQRISRYPLPGYSRESVSKYPAGIEYYSYHTRDVIGTRVLVKDKRHLAGIPDEDVKDLEGIGPLEKGLPIAYPN